MKLNRILAQQINYCSGCICLILIQIIQTYISMLNFALNTQKYMHLLKQLRITVVLSRSLIFFLVYKVIRDSQHLQCI